MEALGQGPRLEVHRGGFAVGIPQHRAAILAGLVALDVPLGHGIAVGVVLLEVGQAQLGLYLAAHTHGHVLEHGLGGEGVDGGTQGDEGGHVGGYVLEQGHGHVPAPGSATVGLLHEGGDGGGEGGDATFEQHLAVGGAAFVALLLEAGDVGKEAVLATVEHLFFEGQLTFDGFLGVGHGLSP